jgi:triosephosphate isomerase
VQVTRSLNSRYQVAAQNASVEGNGAFTGEVAAGMISDVGARRAALAVGAVGSVCG